MQVCEIPFQTFTMVITTTLGVSLKLSLPSLLHSLQHQVTDLCRTLRDDRARLLKRSDLVTGGALTTTDDGTSVTHSPTRRSCPTSDEGDNRLGVGRSLVVLLEVGSGLLLHGTTNFADEDDTFRTGVGKENLDNVDVLGTGEGVTANTNGEGLTKTSKSGLVNGLVSQAAVGGQFWGEALDKLMSTYVPDLETTPILPWRKIWPGIIPILQPSLIIPGQLPPIILLLLWLFKAFITLIWSR